MSDKKIVCINENNVQCEFNYDSDARFFLNECEGIYSISNNVVTSDNTMIDGATYQSSTTQKRNIVISAEMYSDYIANRNFLYKVFKPKSTGKFIYYEETEARTIDYKVESIDIEEKGVVRGIAISLVCPDPFFLEINDVVVEMAAWQSNFKFEHEFLEVGEEFASRISEIIKDIENDSAAENIGITVTFTAEGAAINPAIYHIQTGDFIKVGLTLNKGDSVIVTTQTNNKKIYKIVDGVKTSINELLDEDSEYIQLQHGTNTLKYDADAGIENLNVSISYRNKFLGV